MGDWFRINLYRAEKGFSNGSICGHRVLLLPGLAKCNEIEHTLQTRMYGTL